MALRSTRRSLDLSWLLRIHGHNLDLISVYVLLIFQFEVDVFDDEGPHVVAESVRVQTSLEAQPALHLVCQNFGNDFIEMLEEFDCDLGFYPIFGDECVKRFYEGISDTASPVQFVVHLRRRIVIGGSHAGAGDRRTSG